jgi:hypothetical protein
MKKSNTKLNQSIFFILSLFLFANCKNNSASNEQKNKTEKTNEGEKIRISETKVLNIPEDYVPKGFVIFEKNQRRFKFGWPGRFGFHHQRHPKKQNY